MMIAIFFWWIGLSIVVAVAANTRGRSPIAWFIYAIIFSPLLSGLLLLALPNLANSLAAGVDDARVVTKLSDRGGGGCGWPRGRGGAKKRRFMGGGGAKLGNFRNCGRPGA